MRTATKVALVAVPQTAGSALYGLLDVLSAVGNVWQELVRSSHREKLFDVSIVSATAEPFDCGNVIPVRPAAGVVEDPGADIVIVPELWLGPDEAIEGRYDDVLAWVRRRYDAGAWIYSACSGAVMLAATGLLDGCDATSHWGYEDLFRKRYPKVRFRPAPNLAFADPAGRIVTAGGTTSWHDLALHIIARHASPGEALRISQLYLMKLHNEGQLPYRPLLRGTPHTDPVVRAAQAQIEEHYRDDRVVARVVERSGVPERTLKRRFTAATGTSLLEYLQHVRIEQAKRLLEAPRLPVDQISFEVGYDDASFFRRLFKRIVGLTPSQYRRMFEPIANLEAADRRRSRQPPRKSRLPI